MKRYSEAQRIRLVREYENGGQCNAAEFCRRRRISAGSLARWRRCHGAPVGGEETAQTLTKRWVPVVLTDAAGGAHGSDGGYVVAIGEVRLEVPRGFDLREVRLLCRVLGLGDEEAGA